MSDIPDLEPCTYLSDDPAIIAVGWLDADAAYPAGEMPPELYRKLLELCVRPWQPFAAAGYHTCNLCQFDGPRFTNNLFIPYQSRIYAAPEAITHYIAAHRYLPPAVFLAAVDACPPMQSMDYKRALLANGGRTLLREAASDQGLSQD